MHRSFSFFPILCSLTLFFDDLLFIPGEQFASRVQMTEDELVVNFFQFDGNFCCHCLVCARVCVERDTNGENLVYRFKNQLIGTI